MQSLHSQNKSCTKPTANKHFACFLLKYVWTDNRKTDHSDRTKGLSVPKVKQYSTVFGEALFWQWTFTCSVIVPRWVSAVLWKSVSYCNRLGWEFSQCEMEAYVSCCQHMDLAHHFLTHCKAEARRSLSFNTQLFTFWSNGSDPEDTSCCVCAGGSNLF